MSNPSPSELPSSDAEIERWITAGMDIDRRQRGPGRGWRHRALRNRDMAEVLAERPARTVVKVAIEQSEWTLVARSMQAHGLSTSRFVRMCIGAWLVEHGVDRRRLPTLTRDLP